MKTCITTSHLYGMGGGAKSVFALARGAVRSGSVTIFSRTAIPDNVIQEMPKDGIFYANWYPGCTNGYDLHINVDHFRYDHIDGGDHVAYIFHPHSRNKPPDGYRLLANSHYTASEIKRLWDRDSAVFYLPIENDYYVGNKQKLILHVSRFSAPSVFADKGHRAMVDAFRLMDTDWQLVLAGSVDPQQAGYISSLMSMASGLNVRFAISPSRSDILSLYAESSIYWHMTGVTMPNVPGAQEHLGLTTIEAMASGAVPVVRGTGGQSEIVEDKMNGVLVDGVKDLADITSRLTKELSLWSALQQASIRTGVLWTDQDAFYDRYLQAMGGESNRKIFASGPILEFEPEDVDIIIPVYNSTTIWRCLDNIPPGPNVIVVDNASDEVVNHPRIDKYVRCETNLGFAGGNMRGMEESERSLVLALNDDCIPPDNGGIWLAFMLSIMRDDVGVVGAKLTYPDGRLQHTGVLFDWSRHDIGYHRLYGMVDHPSVNLVQDVPAVTGACLLCRRELFDMRPDLYPAGNYEDAHLCLSAWEKGYRVVYQPASSLIHIEAVTKKRTGIDFVSHNRKSFVDQWAAKFAGSEKMKVVRDVNARLVAGVTRSERHDSQEKRTILSDKG